MCPFLKALHLTVTIYSLVWDRVCSCKFNFQLKWYKQKVISIDLYECGSAVAFSPLPMWGPGRAIKLSAVPFCVSQIIKLRPVTQGDERHPALIHRHQEMDKSWKFVLAFNYLQYYT